MALAGGAPASAQGAYPLVGVWNCQGTYQSQYVFQANGQYSAQSVFGPANGITHWGTWRMVGPTAASQAFIDFVSERDDLSYYTVDTDYGCSIIRKLSAPSAWRLAATSLARSWHRVAGAQRCAA